MDIVYISHLKIDTVIGVYEWEKNIKQTIVLDVELYCDTTRAAATDDLTLALDYAAISSRITAYIEASRFQLIESLAEKTAALVLSEFPVSKLKLQIAKPGAITNARDVGIIIERQS